MKLLLIRFVLRLQLVPVGLLALRALLLLFFLAAQHLSHLMLVSICGTTNVRLGIIL
jgi:hypothetical protein